MKYRLVYEDENGYCKVIVPQGDFKLSGETEETALGRLYSVSIPDVVEFIACKPEYIPSDLTFREAWKKGDIEEPVKIDLQKAILIHRVRLKEACEKKIDKLNRELEIALENGNLPLQVSINKTKKILRNMHEMNLTHIKKPEQLKLAVPDELKDVWAFYPL